MAPTHRKIFVNLAVADVDRAVTFFTALGFSFDERFTDETATCMNVSDEAFVMLLVRERFAEYTSKAIADSATTTEAILSLGADSRDEVDQFADTALANGATAANDPIDVEDVMYGRSFNDPDGHLWEIFWMDPTALTDE